MVFDEDCFQLLSDIQPTTKDGRSLIPAITTIFKSFQLKFEEMMTNLKEELMKTCNESDLKVNALKKEVNSLKIQVSKLEEKIEETEAYSRRDTLVLSGKKIPSFQQNENCSELVGKLLVDNLHLVSSPNEISVAHRLGPKPNSQRPDKRDIIVKFCRRDAKMNIISAARRVKPVDFFVNESLTPQRQTITFVLRKAKREFPEKISGYSTLDGSVSVWVKPPNPNDPLARNSRMVINNFQKLQDFCERILETPLTHFLPAQRN